GGKAAPPAIKDAITAAVDKCFMSVPAPASSPSTHASKYHDSYRVSILFPRMTAPSGASRFGWPCQAYSLGSGRAPQGQSRRAGIDRATPKGRTSRSLSKANSTGSDHALPENRNTCATVRASGILLFAGAHPDTFEAE